MARDGIIKPKIKQIYYSFFISNFFMRKNSTIKKILVNNDKNVYHYPFL